MESNPKGLFRVKINKSILNLIKKLDFNGPQQSTYICRVCIMTPGISFMYVKTLKSQNWRFHYLQGLHVSTLHFNCTQFQPTWIFKDVVAASHLISNTMVENTYCPILPGFACPVQNNALFLLTFDLACHNISDIVIKNSINYCSEYVICILPSFTYHSKSLIPTLHGTGSSRRSNGAMVHYFHTYTYTNWH